MVPSMSHIWPNVWKSAVKSWVVIPCKPSPSLIRYNQFIVFLPNPKSNIVKHAPVFNLERLPNPRGALNSIFNHFSLLAKLQIDVVFVVLSLNMGHINGDQDICRLFLQPDKTQHNSCEVWSRNLRFLVRVGCLSSDESICGNILAVVVSTWPRCKRQREWGKGILR